MYTHFRGTTFQFTGQMQDDGDTLDLTTGTLAAKVFDPSGTNLYGSLIITVVDAVNGLVQMSYPDTSAWPVGKARIDATFAPSSGELIASPPEWFRIAQTPMIG